MPEEEQKPKTVKQARRVRWGRGAFTVTVNGSPLPGIHAHDLEMEIIEETSVVDGSVVHEKENTNA